MFVAPYDGGCGGGAPSNSLLCWFNKQKEIASTVVSALT